MGDGVEAALDERAKQVMRAVPFRSSKTAVRSGVGISTSICCPPRLDLSRPEGCYRQRGRALVKDGHDYPAQTTTARSAANSK